MSVNEYLNIIKTGLNKIQNLIDKNGARSKFCTYTVVSKLKNKRKAKSKQ